MTPSTGARTSAGSRGTSSAGASTLWRIGHAASSASTSSADAHTEHRPRGSREQRLAGRQSRKPPRLRVAAGEQGQQLAVGIAPGLGRNSSSVPRQAGRARSRAQRQPVRRQPLRPVGGKRLRQRRGTETPLPASSPAAASSAANARASHCR